MKYLLIAVGALTITVPSSRGAQTTGHATNGAAGVVAVVNEPAPRLIVDPPLPEALARGLVVVQYQAQYVRIFPVYGPNALDVSPRIGHLHLTLDGAPWHWLDASGEPIVIQYLPPGPHQLLIELVDTNHHLFEGHVVSFVVPKRRRSPVELQAIVR